MVIEPKDIQVLRLAEIRPFYFSDEDLTGTGVSLSEYKIRLKRLQEGGIIRSTHLTLVVPPMLGGNWVWAGVLIRTRDPYGTGQRLATRLPFVTEIVINQPLPEDLGPNLALLLYSRDLETEARFIQSLPELDQVGIFRITDFSYPLASPVSREEKKLIRFLFENPGVDVQQIASSFGRDVEWVKTKILRLLWTEENRSGVIRLQFSIDWSKAENFGHFHFLLETAYRPEQIAKLIGDEGFELVLGGKLVNDRYLAVEADVWGIPDLSRKLDFLEKINGVRVAGVVYNREVQINSSWVANTLGI